VIENNWPEGVPHLSRSAQSDMKTLLQFTGPRKGVLSAWEDLISKLKSFRQDRHKGTQANRPGRSRWPEPDEIRRLTKKRSQKHSIQLSDISSFPRAAFGLPIIFHFKGDDIGDPEQTKLEGPHNSRLASPLILRPLACANEQAVGIALILQGPPVPPGGLVLKGGSDRSKINFEVRSDLSQAEANQISPLNSETDVLQAFLRYVRKETR
jgi:CRISPR-associated protein Cmr1